ncbi:MAG TPA: hypothetical protein VJT31_20410, partial [Rugosimonospora sp.]|nr:hypothetical protein [Rugosimonospora sp.]
MTTLMDDGVDVVSRVIGNAVVIHRSAAMTEQAQEIALRVAPDNEHDLVVVDLPPGSSPAAWGRVAEILPRRRRGVRLILGDRSREAKALAAQLLAERINRTVVAPDGMIHPGVDGALFVDSGPGSGWVRCQPGCAPQWISKRFPRPAWDVSEVSRPVATSASGIAEPVLGGVWIRPVGDDEPLRQHRERLQENLPCQHEVFTVVLGCPGTRAITMDDVARFWVNLPAAVRPRARFVGYGPVNTPAPGLGQALADFLDERVVCYTGLPVASSEFPQVVTVRPDGAWGWNSPAREVAYRPGRGDEPPELLSYRAPLDDVMEVRPAVYWYAPDAVVEVIPAGLWVRRAIGGVGATMVRARQIDAEHLLVVFDTATDAVQRRMRMLAADMVAWLDEATRRTAVLVGAHEVAASAVPAAQPAGADVGEQPQARRTVYNGRITIEDAALAEPARYDLEPLFDGVTPALPAAGPPAGTVIPVEAPQ